MISNLVSVMMPAYNAEQYIGHAIDSLLSQSYEYWELIVVNDGSTDKTQEIVQQYHDLRIKIVQQENKGEAVARNTALRSIQGEFIAFLDADDLYLPNHLELTVGYLKSQGDCDGVYTDGYHCDEKGNWLKSLSNRRRGPFEGYIFEEVVKSSDVFGPPVCVVLRRDIVLKYDLEFDPQIVIGPDWDFLSRYSEFASFKYIDQHTCLYRVHLSNITSRIGLKERSRHLAKCRMNAIKLNGFKTLSLETRLFVFYDLLVNLLTGFPEQQSAITRWPEFRSLPNESQARLFRLMASRAIVIGGAPSLIKEWFHFSKQLNPSDKRGALLATIYNLNPLISQTLLRIKNFRQVNVLNAPPFQDLK